MQAQFKRQSLKINMKRKFFHFQFIFIAVLVVFLLPAIAHAQNSVEKKTSEILLGETPVKVNVYEKKGATITFFAPHYNERIGTGIALQLINNWGGRVVEIESLDEVSGNPTRRLKFLLQGQVYTVDPNRIFTDNGRACDKNLPEVVEAVKSFSTELLKVIFAEDGSNRLRSGEKFLVAVHNNMDVSSAASDEAKAKDLTSYSFLRNGKIPNGLTGEYQDQVGGVFLSNTEFDEDNFLFLSTPNVGLEFFAGKGFNVVVQRQASNLPTQNCRIDDGSLSVFAGQRNIPYINVEADTIYGAWRQRQMLEAVYEYWQKTK